MIASFAAISARVFWQIWREPWCFPFVIRFGIIPGFLVLSFLSGGSGAIEALILSSCLLVQTIVSFVVFVFFVWPFHTTRANARP